MSPAVIHTTAPATPNQQSFIASLLKGRDIPPALRQRGEKLLASPESFPRKQASDMITWLLSQPRIKDAPPVILASANLSAAPLIPPQTPGVFRKDGEIYVVKGNQPYRAWQKQGSPEPRPSQARLYAKRLVTSADHLTEAGTTIPFDLVYSPGVVASLTEADRMPLAEAEELTVKFGSCLACGRTLKAAESVKKGIGPVCIKYFA